MKELNELKNKIRVYKGIVLTVLILAILSLLVDLFDIYDLYTFI